MCSSIDSDPTCQVRPGKNAEADTHEASDNNRRRLRRTWALRLTSAVCLLSVIFGSPSQPAASETRWPLWPSEVERIAQAFEPLEDGSVPSDSLRLAALRETDAYATALVAPIIVRALDDPANHVKRDALIRCSERELLACSERALELWSNPRATSSLRMYALRVLLLDPKPGNVDLLVSAMQASDPQLRTMAVDLATEVSLSDTDLERVRAQVVAKLADGVPNVRQTALRTLGTLGPGSGALTVVTQLEDPTPQVRREAGRTLGLMRDPRAAPALLRALRAGDESYVSETMLHALVLLPGEEVDRALLEFLDDPPRGLSRRILAQKIGLRPNPSPELLEQLTARLQESDLHSYVLTSLLLQGEQAREVLEAARSRGLEPGSDLEVQRLLANLDHAEVEDAPMDSWRSSAKQQQPSLNNRRAWLARLQAPPRARLDAARTLGQASPVWLFDATMAGIGHRQHPGPVRGHLLALANSRGDLPRHNHIVYTNFVRLAAWARDRSLSPSDRCLASFALARGRDGGAQLRKLSAETLEDLAGDPSAELRGCVAQLLSGTDDPLLLALLHDPSAGVRAHAAFALRYRIKHRRRDGAVGPLAAVAAADPNWRVRQTAREALSIRTGHHEPVVQTSQWFHLDYASYRSAWLVVTRQHGETTHEFFLPPTTIDRQLGVLLRLDQAETMTVSPPALPTETRRAPGLFFRF